jgi:hypothetical protein
MRIEQHRQRDTSLTSPQISSSYVDLRALPDQDEQAREGIETLLIIWCRKVET